MDCWMYRRRLADSASATRITWWTIIQEMHPSLFDAHFFSLFWFPFCLIANLFDLSLFYRVRLSASRWPIFTWYRQTNRRGEIEGAFIIVTLISIRKVTSGRLHLFNKLTISCKIPSFGFLTNDFYLHLSVSTTNNKLRQVTWRCT